MEQLIFFLLNVSDTDPNTATSVAPATTWKKRWIQLNHFHKTESDRGHQTKVEERTDSVVEALNVRCQNRISNLRLFLDSLEYICMVCHLHKGANHVEYRIITSHFPAPAFIIETWSTTYSWKKVLVGLTVTVSFRLTVTVSVDQEKRIIKNSALYHSEQRRLLTCGTHFEETKLVASITGRPASESMSISWIFSPVGTISWNTMKLKMAWTGFDGRWNATDFVPATSHVCHFHLCAQFLQSVASQGCNRKVVKQCQISKTIQMTHLSGSDFDVKHVFWTIMAHKPHVWKAEILCISDHVQCQDARKLHSWLKRGDTFSFWSPSLGPTSTSFTNFGYTCPERVWKRA